MGRSRGEGGAWGPELPEKSHVAMGFLKNSDTDTYPREAIGPIRYNCLSRELRTAHCEIR